MTEGRTVGSRTILGHVWYLIVLIPDPGCLPYFVKKIIYHFFSRKQTGIIILLMGAMPLKICLEASEFERK